MLYFYLIFQSSIFFHYCEFAFHSLKRPIISLTTNNQPFLKIRTASWLKYIGKIIKLFGSLLNGQLGFPKFLINLNLLRKALFIVDEGALYSLHQPATSATALIYQILLQRVQNLCMAISSWFLDFVWGLMLLLKILKSFLCNSFMPLLKILYFCVQSFDLKFKSAYFLKQLTILFE